MRRQDCTQRPGPGTLFRFQVTGDGNHARGRSRVAESLDELELPFWIESYLEGDDRAGAPVVGLGLSGGERLSLDAQAARGHPDALREKQVVLDYVETRRHRSRIAGRFVGVAIWPSPKGTLRLL